MVWISGEWKVTCDVCSKEIYASEAKHRWDGLIVCEQDYEERHPLDFIKVRIEDLTVPFSRPEPPDTFITSCNMATSSGYTDLGTTDCSQVGQTWGMSYQDLLDNYVCTPTGKLAIAGLAVAGCARSGNTL